MSDEGKRIAIISPDGQFGTIDAKHAEAVTKAGGRVLSKQEAADRELQAEYAKKSTAEKLAAVATNAGPAGWLAGKAYTAATGRQLELPPELEAYKAGVDKSTIVMPHVNKAIADATGDHNAGAQYVERQDKLQEASPIAAGLGEAVGTIGGALVGSGVGAAGKLGAAAKFANPAATAINAAGNLAERGVASALGSASLRGVLAKAGVEALKMGARGAVEGGLYAGAQSASDDLLHDKDVAIDKLFAATGTGALYGGAGGALLGGASSLASSGLGAARDKVAGMLAPKVEQAAVDGAKGSASRPAAQMTEAPQRSLIGDLASEQGTKALAYDRAWSSLGGGFGLQSTDFAKRAARYLPNGTADVGEVLMRKGIIDPNAGIIDAARGGTPAAMLPKIEPELEKVGQRIGQLTDASGGRVAAKSIQSSIDDLAKPYEAAAATRPVAKEIRAFGEQLKDSLNIADGSADSVAVQDLLRERKAMDMMVFDNTKVDVKLAMQVKRELRGKLEGLVVDAMDEASGRLKGDLASEYKALKKDYLALNIAQEAAEDSAARAAKAGFVGLKDLAYGSGSLLKSLASKAVRTHGDAVAATMLYRAAERQTLTKWVQKVDDQIGKASKGLLQPAAPGLPKAADRMPPAKQLVTKALATVADFQRDPEAHIEKVTRQVESIAAHDPELADGLVQRHVQAQAFLASKVPTVPDPDPMDPHPAPKMTPNEQAEFARYAWYTEKPARFFAEVARGKITFEGAETAKALMPRAFAELQDRTQEEIANQMAKGNKIPYRQRQYLGVLLDMAATPSQRPDHAAFLQKNVTQNDPPPPPPHKPLASGAKSHMSALDRLESDGVGRR